jgi:hypothetical protein
VLVESGNDETVKLKSQIKSFEEETGLLKAEIEAKNGKYIL